MIKLTAHVSKKVPLPGVEYSSRSFSAGIEVEVADGVDVSQLRGRLQVLYGLLESSVDEQIAAEAALDGFYVIRTDVPREALDAGQTVRAYKNLSKVERAFRRIKTVDLHIRPIHHRTSDRVRAHVLLCMLAYYVEWEMRQRLAPVLFADEDPAAGRALQASPVAPAQRSPVAKRKAATQRTDDDRPVHSFQTVLADLATIAKNRIQPSVPGAESFEKTTCPTSNQQRILDLLGASVCAPDALVPSTRRGKTRSTSGRVRSYPLCWPGTSG